MSQSKLKAMTCTGGPVDPDAKRGKTCANKLLIGRKIGASFFVKELSLSQGTLVILATSKIASKLKET